MPKSAYFNDVCVGAIVFDKAEDSILVEALAVLPAYRSLGLGV